MFSSGRFRAKHRNQQTITCQVLDELNEIWSCHSLSCKIFFLAAMILFKISPATLFPGSSFSYSSNKKNEAYLYYFSLSFLFYSSNFRPSLTRAETIESCNSDDLVTVLEMHNRKPYKIIDRKREVKKGVMAETLDELVNRGKILQKL